MVETTSERLMKERNSEIEKDNRKRGFFNDPFKARPVVHPDQQSLSEQGIDYGTGVWFPNSKHIVNVATIIK